MNHLYRRKLLSSCSTTKTEVILCLETSWLSTNCIASRPGTLTTHRYETLKLHEVGRFKVGVGECWLRED
jgi:hypothetical protein